MQQNILIEIYLLLLHFLHTTIIYIIIQRASEASEADSQGCSIEISIYMSVCRMSKINAYTWVIARASFGVLKAWTAFNRTHTPYYCPATNNCKVCLLFTI